MRGRTWHTFEKDTFHPFFLAGGYLKSDMLAELESGAPIEPVIERLLLTGVDAETAGNVIRAIKKGRSKYSIEAQH
jgi:hypothetical protein